MITITPEMREKIDRIIEKSRKKGKIFPISEAFEKLDPNDANTIYINDLTDSKGDVKNG